MPLPSTARKRLSWLIDMHGGGGILLIRRDLAESANGADLAPGSMEYPPCTCPAHRAGRGRRDSSVRLSAGTVDEPLTEVHR